MKQQQSNYTRKEVFIWTLCILESGRGIDGGEKSKKHSLSFQLISNSLLSFHFKLTR